MAETFDDLDLFQLLDLLEPAPEPPPVSWMPQTIGWVWLGLALVVLTALALRRVLAHRRATAYRRAALAELDAAGDDPAEIASILRRTALAGYPRTDVVALSGTDWLAFLDRTLPGTGFTNGPGRIVATAPYKAAEPEPDLAALARQWVRHHRPLAQAAR